jgi:hypothetical protein
MPEQYNLLTSQVEIGGETKNLNLEVAQHIGDNMVRAISLQPPTVSCAAPRAGHRRPHLGARGQPDAGQGLQHHR